MSVEWEDKSLMGESAWKLWLRLLLLEWTRILNTQQEDLKAEQEA